MSASHHYSVFGGCLRSEIPFPELRASDPGAPDWTLRCARGSPPELPRELLGDDRVCGEVRVRLYRVGGGYRMEYDDTGSFDLMAGGREITWYPGPRADERAARADVLGRVLAMAMHLSGTLCLHGSAVGMGSGAAVFVAPKFFGKSTLAQALVDAGAGMITDDTIAIEPGPPALLRPGVHRAQLWGDSAARLGRAPVGEERSPGGKVIVDRDEADLVMRAVPCSAIYLLAPVPPDEGRGAALRTRLPQVPATVFLVGQNKLGPLLTRSETGVLFERIGRLVTTVPVFRLEVARSFERLPDVVERLLRWHGGPDAPGLSAPLRCGG